MSKSFFSTPNSKSRDEKTILKKFEKVQRLLDKLETNNELYGTCNYDRDGQEFDLGYISALAWVLGIELKGGTSSRVEQVLAK